MKELRENTAKVRNHTLQRGQNGQILPRREKYYNIVSLTNTSNIANAADWETCEWTKRANIAAICQKRPPSALFPTIKQKKLQISIRIGGLCIHSRDVNII